MDAIVSERLLSNTRIIDIFGYCGTGMISEAMMNGSIGRVAMPSGEGRGVQYKGIEKSLTLQVFNELSGTLKLKYALEMTEALLLLHSYPDGVIVHNGKIYSSCFYLLSA